MEDRRKSRWHRIRVAYGRAWARETIRDESWPILGLFGVGGLGCIWEGVTRIGEPIGVALLAASGVLALLLWGLWTGRRWAGLCSGVAALVCAALGVVGLAAGESGSLVNTIGRAVLIPFWIGMGVFLLRPSTRRIYDEAQAELEPPSRRRP